jgi:hypothetical protein
VVVKAAFLGSEADGRALLAPVRALGPGMDTVRHAAPGRAQRPGHGPARPAALPLPGTRSSTSCPARPSTTSRGQPGPARRSRSSSSATWAARARAPHARRRRARPRCPARSPCWRLGVVPEPAAEQAVEEQIDGVLGTVARHRAGDYPKLRRAAGGREHVLRPGERGGACARSRRSTTRRPVQGQPSRPAAERAGKLYAARVSVDQEALEERGQCPRGPSSASTCETYWSGRTRPCSPCRG